MNAAELDPRWGQVDRDKKADAILATVEAFRGDARDGVWLDIGCGSGGVANTLATQVRCVIGVDPETWERWQAYTGASSNLRLLRGSYRDLSTLLGQEGVDVVVCNQVYEHVDDPAALLEVIRDVLKPGGLCYFAGPNLIWPVEPHVFWPFVHWLPRAFAQAAMRALGSKRAHDLDAWSWSYWKLTRAFRAAGLHYRVAIRERIAAQAAVSRSLLVRAAARVPLPLVRVLTPIAPGFVFVLSKPG